jgi:hypothetical protein
VRARALKLAADAHFVRRTAQKFMNKLSALGFAFFLCAAVLGLVSAFLRSGAKARRLTWWVGPFAPRESFSPEGWYCAIAARVLGILGLVLLAFGGVWSSVGS